MSEIATAPAPKKANLIVTIGALTVLAIVGGGLVGKLLAARLAATPQPALTETAAPKPYSTDVDIRELPPIVTNLAEPPTARVRIQVAIVFKKKAVENPTMLMAQINDDLIAFINTLSLRAIEGASGLQNLRADLEDRAAARSDGKVSEVIIETLVMQ